VTATIGADAFCPGPGAPLTEKRHYDASGRGRRAVADDEVAHFRRCHARHGPEAPELYGTAALSVRRLHGARDPQPTDLVVWYALERRQTALGHDVEWMHAHAALRCPACHGRLRFERAGEHLTARCATRCPTEGEAALETLRRRVAALYDDAFSDAAPLSPDAVLDARYVFMTRPHTPCQRTP
jgi:hypothetical protein